MILKPTRIVILGSTGSIGKNVIKVVNHLNNLNKRKSVNKKIEIFGLVANSNWSLLRKQIKSVKPYIAALTDKKASDVLIRYFKNSKVKLCKDKDEIHKLISHSKVDVVVVAISGAEALPFTLTAIKAGKSLALANKEVLVMAGDTVTKMAQRNRVNIMPIDSEHSAIFQALNCGQASEVKRVILTASGGPFYNYSRKRLKKIMPKQALKHPTWKMGPKVTIDSATLMNKALEIIEARWLFNLEPEQIKVLIHPQSIVHSMVEFQDGSTIAQMGQPDMRIPIQFALTYPKRQFGLDTKDIWQKPRTFVFTEPDKKRFPAIALAYNVLDRGGTVGAVFNAANEKAVSLFRNKEIFFTDIVPLVKKVMNKHKTVKKPKLKDILKADKWAREVTTSKLLSKGFN